MPLLQTWRCDIAKVGPRKINVYDAPFKAAAVGRTLALGIGARWSNHDPNHDPLDLHRATLDRCGGQREAGCPV
jgi:hypothetical protein